VSASMCSVRPLVHADLIALAKMVEFEIRKEWPQFSWGVLATHRRSVPSQSARLSLALVAREHRFSLEQAAACIGTRHSTMYDAVGRHRRGETNPDVVALVGKVVAAICGGAR